MKNNEHNNSFLPPCSLSVYVGGAKISNEEYDIVPDDLIHYRFGETSWDMHLICIADNVTYVMSSAHNLVGTSTSRDYIVTINNKIINYSIVELNLGTFKTSHHIFLLDECINPDGKYKWTPIDSSYVSIRRYPTIRREIDTIIEENS